jgi:hypothetical protein
MGEAVSNMIEISRLRDQLPSAETKFVLKEEAPILLLDNATEEIMDAARPFLSRGTTGDELARSLQIGEERVLMALYKLRAAGQIQVYRPEAAAGPQSRAASQGRIFSAGQSRASMARRLLGILTGSGKRAGETTSRPATH